MNESKVDYLMVPEGLPVVVNIPILAAAVTSALDTADASIPAPFSQYCTIERPKKGKYKIHRCEHHFLLLEWQK